MHHIVGAGYLSGNRQGCLRGTRKDVLLQIECWLTDERDQRVFWLNGLAGTGKSTIAQTFAENSFADGKLGASFFCSRDFEDRSDIHNIFPTLAFQLAYRYPQFRKELLPVLRANPEVGRESLCSQLEKLLVGPLGVTRISTLIIIDALDECRDEQPASALLSVLSRYIDRVPHVKFFITGRPEPRIRTGFRLELLRPITEVLKLHDVKRSSVDSDIRLFLRTRLGDIAKTRSDCDLTEEWPSPDDINVLCEKSAGLFVYASTVVKFVSSPSHLPVERLALIISLPQSTANEGKSGIDLLYTQVLEQAFQDIDEDDRELYSRFKLVVGVVLLAFHPLPRNSLSELLKDCGTSSRVSNALRFLHSLLLVPNSEVEPIRIFHKSFPDFLTDRTRCKDERFFVDPPVHHIDILFLCLDLMRERLKKNICYLDCSLLLTKVEDLRDRTEARIGGALEYACRFWTKHLLEISGHGPHIERAKDEVDDFFKKRLLFWIEVLSLTGNLHLGVYALHDIDQWYLSVSCMEHVSKLVFTYPQIGVSCKWTSESQRFILLHFDEICRSPARVYRYLLSLCPSSSWLHDWYTAESIQGVKVVNGRPDKWGACSRIVSFDYYPKAIASHKDMVVVGLSSGDIIILDAITGTRRSALLGHVDGVVSLAFSLDGTLLVSGSKDDTVKLWDIQTGGLVKTFRSNVYRVRSVSISPDSTTIVSGSRINAICLWDVRTGECYRIIKLSPKSQGHVVISVIFPPSTRGHLVSVSAGGLVQQWDINGSEIRPQMPGYISFSPDGSRFVLYGNESPTVRDSDSGTTITTLPSVQNLHFCCFSPSGEFIAGHSDAAIYVWDISHQNARLAGTFASHDSSISSLLYSSSIVSVFSDRTVRFLKIDDSSLDQATTKWTALTSAEITQVFLRGEKDNAISVNSDRTVKIWDLSTDLHTTLSQAFPAAGVLRDARLVKGQLIITCHQSTGWWVSFWDLWSRQCVQTTRLLNAVGIDHIMISEDGTLVFAAGRRYTKDEGYIRTWCTTTGTPIASQRIQWPDRKLYLPITVDGPTVWIRFGSSLVKGWDIKNLGSVGPIESSDIPSERHRLSLIQVDGEPEGQDGDPTRIVDTVTNEEVFRLTGEFAQPVKIKWDGRCLFAVYEAGEPLILDFVHMTPR